MKLNVTFQEQNDMIRGPSEIEERIGIDFSEVQTRAYNYNELENRPSINSVVLEGNLTSEDLGISASFPGNGNIGDVLMKTGDTLDGVSWVTPASSVEQDNTRPITSAAVYTEVGNINALLATI